MSPSALRDTIARALEAAGQYAWRTVVYRNTSRDGKYLFMEPNGDAMVISGNDEHVVGNFLDDFAGVLSTWRAYVDTERLTANATATYWT